MAEAQAETHLAVEVEDQDVAQEGTGMILVTMELDQVGGGMGLSSTIWKVTAAETRS